MLSFRLLNVTMTNWMLELCKKGNFGVTIVDQHTVSIIFVEKKFKLQNTFLTEIVLL